MRLLSDFLCVEASYLITVGKIQRAIPTPADGLRILCPGISMPSDNQTSPMTCAKDVKISAKMMSEKYTGSSPEEVRHLRIELARKSISIEIWELGTLPTY